MFLHNTRFPLSHTSLDQKFTAQNSLQSPILNGMHIFYIHYLKLKLGISTFEILNGKRFLFVLEKLNRE